jgi:hypothetical protein
MTRQQVSKAAAWRIWQALREPYGQGGFVLFDKDGKGGTMAMETETVTTRLRAVFC